MSFFAMYILFLYSAAYNIQQSFEGLDLSSSNFLVYNQDGIIIGSYLSPSEAVIPIFVILIIYFIFLTILLLFSGYILGRKKGVFFVLMIMIIPGILGWMDLAKYISWLPDKYIISGTGFLGNGVGLFAIVIIGMLTGWAIITIIYTLFLFGERFRQGYDILWYLSALLAGVFFVSDSSKNMYLQESNETLVELRATNQYFLEQVKKYESYCISNNILEKESCQWASDIQQLFHEYITYNQKLYISLGPSSINDIYSPLWHKRTSEQIFTIRSELKAYNDQLCPSHAINKIAVQLAPISSTCQSIPSNFCDVASEEDNEMFPLNILGNHAIANECLTKKLVRLKAQFEKFEKIGNQNAKEKHFRWLYYIIFSFIIGGKIANTTTKLFGVDNQSRHERRFLISWFAKIGSLIYRLIKITISFTKKSILLSFCYLKKYFTSIHNMMKIYMKKKKIRKYKKTLSK